MLALYHIEKEEADRERALSGINRGY